MQDNQGQTTNQRLEDNQRKLMGQEEILYDTLHLMKDTQNLLQDGHQNLQGQTAKINKALDYQNEIGTELNRADNHVKAIKRNEGCMKILLFIVALLLFGVDVVALFYKLFKPKSK